MLDSLGSEPKAVRGAKNFACKKICTKNKI